jgi:hypothetical protein
MNCIEIKFGFGMKNINLVVNDNGPNFGGI